MRHRLILLALAIGSMVVVAMPSPWVHGPYTGAPSGTSVTISWLAANPYPARVEYQRAGRDEHPSLFSCSVSIPEDGQDSGRTVHVTLDSLKPKTEYAYRVVLETSEGTAVSPIGRFVTAPSAGSTISFAVVADTQWQWEGENRLRSVAETMAQDPTPFDFILHGGDLVETPDAEHWAHWFSSFETLLLRAPILPVLGNHEQNHVSYYEQFTVPPGQGRQGKQWWVLRWGDVVVVGLDTNVRQASQIIAQQAWARAQLSGPERHKFVIFHHPVFSSEAARRGRHNYDVIYHPIFVEHGVSIVFTAHAHHYERVVADGVTYLVVGGGGAIPRGVAEERVEGSKVAHAGHNFYVRVESSPTGVQVEVISVARADEERFDLTPGMILDAFFQEAE